MDVSVIIPVYNELATIAEVIRRVSQQPMATEIIVVDDGSTDGTGEALRAGVWPAMVRVFYHSKNRGKGASVRTGIAAGDAATSSSSRMPTWSTTPPTSRRCCGHWTMAWPMSSMVRGSSALTAHSCCTTTSATRLLTLLTNVLYNNILTDMETGYKAFRREVLQGLPLRCDRFDFEPEITAKVLSAGTASTRCRSTTPVATTPRARRSPGATASARSGHCGVASRIT